MTSNTYVQVPGNVLQHLYVNGCQPSYTSTTTVTIAAGQVRDSTDSFDIAVSAPLVINFAVRGANGLDTGSFAASTGYYLYVLYDQSQTNAPVALASLSATAPTMPSVNGVTFSHFRLVGWVLSDGSTHILPFYVARGGSNPFYQWDAPINVLTGGAATTATAVSLATAMPKSNFGLAQLNMVYTPHAAGETASLKPTAATAVSFLFNGVVASVVQNTSVLIVPTLNSSNPSVSYLVSVGTAPAAVSLNVTGFEMAL